MQPVSNIYVVQVFHLKTETRETGQVTRKCCPYLYNQPSLFHLHVYIHTCTSTPVHTYT